MGRIYKRGETWWGYWRDARGGAHRASLKTQDKSVARDRLRVLELAPPDQRSHGQSLEGALTYLLDVAYAGRAAGTLNCYRTKARHLVRLLGGETPLRSLTRPTILQYRAMRLTEGAAETTVHKELVVLRRTLSEAGLEGIVPRTAVRYRPRERHLTHDEFLTLLEQLSTKRQLWLMVAFYGGLRAHELEILEWSNVDLKNAWLRVPGTKTAGSFRRVPIAVPLLRRLASAERSGDLVLRPWPNYNRDLGAACKRGGIAPVSANDLRRTFASWLKQAGVDSLTVAHLLGHSSTRMVELVYGRLTASTYENAIALLPVCTPGVHNQVHSRALPGTHGTSGKDLSTGNPVPRAGIEPATRGFSVLCSTN